MIQLSFDRYLLPATITRQSYGLFNNLNEPIATLPLKTIYDPVARTVTIGGPEGPGKTWLVPGQEYKLALPVPRDDASDIGGFRAIDRSPLDPAQERVLAFRAGPPTGQPAYEPSVDFCADVLPLFQVKCGDATCHGAAPGSGPVASLVLNSAEGIRVTARDRVAQGANTSARAGAPEPPRGSFGINMAIIAPGDPGSSWLMYKIELGRLPAIDGGAPPTTLCTPPAGSPPVPAPAARFDPLAPYRPAADETERSILEDFVLGREMPYPTGGADYSSQPLTFQERERIRIWIARGADVRECGGCGVVAAGTPAAPAP